jgi:hypothetical protein
MKLSLLLLFIIVAIVLLSSVLFVHVSATSIASISPTNGPPGTSVTLTGSIDTPMGSWQVLFANGVVGSGTAGPNADVQASFTIPGGTPPGTYSITLQDMQTNTQSLAQFTVTQPQPQAGYTDWSVVSVSIQPAAPKVGDSVTLGMTTVALSSTGTYPQNVIVQCTFDGSSCGSNIISYPGPTGTSYALTSPTSWTATAGTQHRRPRP